MADIQIVYRIGHCFYECPDYQTQCHTQCASDMGCRWFSLPNHEENEIPFGDCAFAEFKYKFKGWSGKKYDIEEVEDYMLVKLGNNEYECVKVILNGDCIYNNYDEEGDT